MIRRVRVLTGTRLFLTLQTSMKASATVLLFAAAVLSSCVSVEKAAPPVVALDLGKIKKPAAQLQCGRDLYVGKCAKCHSPEPIADHSPSEWKSDILPTMCKKAKLDDSERNSLHDYILAVLEHPPVNMGS